MKIFFFTSGCGAIFLYFVNSRKGDSFTGETNDTLARGFAGPLQVPLVSGGSGRSILLVTEVRLGEGMDIICVLYTKSMLSLIFCFATWFFSSVLMTDSTDLKHFLHIPPVTFLDVGSFGHFFNTLDPFRVQFKL